MVHLTYQTAFVDDAGKLQLRDDIYGFDARIHAILHSDERRIADVAPPQDPKRDAGDRQANQDILRRVERREAHEPVRLLRAICPLDLPRTRAKPQCCGRIRQQPVAAGPRFHAEAPPAAPAPAIFGHFRPLGNRAVRGATAKRSLTLPDKTA